MRLRDLHAAAALLTVVLLAAACTSGDDDKSSAPPTPDISGRVASGSPSLAPLTVASRAAWSVVPGAVTDVSDITVAGSTVVVTGTGADTSVAPMTALDASTGAARWTVADLGDFTGGGGAAWTEHAPIAAAGSSPLLLTDYYVPHCTTTAHTCPAGSTDAGNPEHGVVALSPTDGHVVWQNALIPSVPEGSAHSRDWQGATVDVVAVVNGLAVVTVELSAGSQGGGASYDNTRTVALDAATGTVRWSAAGFEALAATGDHVAGLTGLPHLILSTVGALDLRTGAKRWALSGSLAGALFLADSGPAVAVRVPGDDVTVLRATDGRSVGVTESTTLCKGSDKLLSCLSGVDPQRLATYAAGEPSPATSLGEVGSIETIANIIAVHDGYTILSRSSTVLAFDRAANTPGPPLPDGTQYLDDTTLVASADGRVSLYSVG